MADKFVFIMRSGGNETLTLAGTRDAIVYNKIGDPIARKTVQPLQLIFEGGIAETENEDTVQLMTDHKDFGPGADKRYYWHPASVPGKAMKDDEAAKAALVASRKKRARQDEAVIKARSGEVSRDRG